MDHFTASKFLFKAPPLETGHFRISRPMEGSNLLHVQWIRFKADQLKIFWLAVDLLEGYS